MYIMLLFSIQITILKLIIYLSQQIYTVKSVQILNERYPSLNFNSLSKTGCKHFYSTDNNVNKKSLKTI